jgi:hypothetical protein
MSSFVKADGAKIVVKFDKPLIGDVTGLTPPLGYISTEISKNSSIGGQVYSASNVYTSSYTANKAFDSDIATLWLTLLSAPQWIQVDFGEGNSYAANKFRWYIGSTSYTPNAFNLKGSNDAITWSDALVNSNSTNSVGWKEWSFTNNTTYRYYRWEITSKWSLYIGIYEIELFADIPIGQERAFKVEGQQLFNINDELITGDYRVESVEAHPVISNAVLLNMKPLNRFHNVVGDLSVTYNEGLGSLQGSGGIVLGFTEVFTPLDLIAKPNQNPEENVEIANVIVTGLLQEVTRLNSYLFENVEIANVSATGTLINVEDL